MGQPNHFGGYFFTEHIGLEEHTQGIETSQYLKEKKTIVIPLVAASERGLAQTVRFTVRGCGARHNATKNFRRTLLDKGDQRG